VVAAEEQLGRESWATAAVVDAGCCCCPAPEWKYVNETVQILKTVKF
jgi:hypothetical protein